MCYSLMILLLDTRYQTDELSGSAIGCIQDTLGLNVYCDTCHLGGGVCGFIRSLKIYTRPQLLQDPV